VATPSFRPLEDEEYTTPEPPDPWKRPAKYIQHVGTRIIFWFIYYFKFQFLFGSPELGGSTEKTPAALEKSVEYDLDSDDESFRLALNTKMKNKSVLNENTLEKLIDTFEKEYFKQVRSWSLLNLCRAGLRSER
jgi:hypothetical protein